MHDTHQDHNQTLVRWYFEYRKIRIIPGHPSLRTVCTLANGLLTPMLSTRYEIFPYRNGNSFVPDLNASSNMPPNAGRG
jgi:hypothetical protein